MTTLLGLLGTYLLHSTILLGAAVLVERVAAREQWREMLWKTALVGALVTVAVQTALVPTPVGGSLALNLPAPAPVTMSAPPQAPSPVAPPAAAPDAEALSTPTAPRRAWADHLPEILVVAWGLVAVVLMVSFVAPFVSVWRRLRVSSRPDPDLQSRWDTLVREAGGHARARLVVSDAFRGPAAAVGGIVAVPARFTTDLTPEEQRAALAHELAHVVRRDPEWRLAAGVVARLFFVQPLNLLAARRLRGLAETLSDEWAVRRATTASALARCLVRVAEWGLAPKTGVVGIVERPSSLHARVRHLLDTPRMPRPVSLVARLVLGVVVLAVVAAAAPRTDLTGDRLFPVSFLAGDGHGPILVAPDSIATLDGRWAWAEAEVRRRGLDGAWFGYAIARTRLHPGEVFIADSRGMDPSELEGPSVLTARLLGPLTGRAADLVGLFVSPSGEGIPSDVSVRTLSVLGDLGGRPVVWLGVITVSESLDHWTRPAPAWPAPLEARRVTALAVHPLPTRVLPLLDAVALSDAPAEVRVQAVEGYSYQADAAHRRDVLARLDRVLARDLPEPVIHEAVRVLARLAPAGEATTRLAALLRTGRMERRSQAVHSLADVPASVARPLLLELLRGPLPPEARREAEDVLHDLGPVETGAALQARPAASVPALAARPVLPDPKPVAERPSSLSPPTREDTAPTTVSVGYDHVVTDGDGGAAVWAWTTRNDPPQVRRQRGERGSSYEYTLTTGDRPEGPATRPPAPPR